MLANEPPQSATLLSICAVIDFVWGCIKWHSVAAGLVAIVGGLPLAAVLYFLFGAFRRRFLFSVFRKGKEDSNAHRT
jgi:hypothetical protein